MSTGKRAPGRPGALLAGLLLAGCAGGPDEPGAAGVASAGELAGRAMELLNARYRGPRSWEDVLWKDYGDATDEYAHFSAGEKAFYAARYAEAAAHFSRAIAVAPRARQYSYRGWSYASLGRFPEAERDARKAIELEPKSPLGYFDLASFAAMQGQVEAACGALRKALERGLKPRVLHQDPDLLRHLQGQHCFEQLRRRG